MGRIIQVIVELGASEREILMILGCVLISDLCLRFEVDELNIAEFSVFPYYWGETNHGDAGETFRSVHNRFLGIYFRNGSQV